MGFRIWLEQEDRPVIFCDLDETLLHKEKMVQPPKGVKEIQVDGETIHVLPRPGLDHFLQEINKFADLNILTHSPAPAAEKAIRVLEIGKYIANVYHTGNQASGSLATEKKWVLVDNLEAGATETIHKLRILGLGHEKKMILDKAKDHFIHVKTWTDERNDSELQRLIPKIKALLS